MHAAEKGPAERADQGSRVLRCLLWALRLALGLNVLVLVLGFWTVDGTRLAAAVQVARLCAAAFGIVVSVLAVAVPIGPRATRIAIVALAIVLPVALIIATHCRFGCRIRDLRHVVNRRIGDTETEPLSATSQTGDRRK
jgi:hypothetical protein